MYVCMCALQLNELSALRNTVYPEYKYVCVYVCLLLSIIGIFGYHLGFYFLFFIGIIWYFNNKVLKNFIININFAL